MVVTHSANTLGTETNCINRWISNFVVLIYLWCWTCFLELMFFLWRSLSAWSDPVKFQTLRCHPTFCALVLLSSSADRKPFLLVTLPAPWEYCCNPVTRDRTYCIHVASPCDRGYQKFHIFNRGLCQPVTYSLLTLTLLTRYLTL